MDDSRGDTLRFNSRTPGGVRLTADDVRLRPRDVSIHAPREGCDIFRSFVYRKYIVSIHAPREGCDRILLLLIFLTLIVSIHAPREGCDQASAVAYGKILSFNSRTPGGVRL